MYSGGGFRERRPFCYGILRVVAVTSWRAFTNLHRAPTLAAPHGYLGDGDGHTARASYAQYYIRTCMYICIYIYTRTYVCNNNIIIYVPNIITCMCAYINDILIRATGSAASFSSVFLLKHFYPADARKMFFF